MNQKDKKEIGIEMIGPTKNVIDKIFLKHIIIKRQGLDRGIMLA